MITRAYDKSRARVGGPVKGKTYSMHTPPFLMNDLADAGLTASYPHKKCVHCTGVVCTCSRRPICINCLAKGLR